MHSIGVDIIEVERIREARDRFGERFLNRIFTVPELNVCRSRPGSLASRFAGKEAIMKALGTGVKGIGWREIEILLDPSGKPFVNLYGRALERWALMGLGELSISLSDSKEYAVAVVVSEYGHDA